MTRPPRPNPDAAKKKPARQETATRPRVAELEKENRQLKAQVAELQKRVQELESRAKGRRLPLPGEASS